MKTIITLVAKATFIIENALWEYLGVETRRIAEHHRKQANELQRKLDLIHKTNYADAWNF